MISIIVFYPTSKSLMGTIQKNSQSFQIIWMFPKIVVPPNHPILIGFSNINHPFWGPAPIFGNTHLMFYPTNSTNSLDKSPLRWQGKGRLRHESVIDHDLAGGLVISQGQTKASGNQGVNMVDGRKFE